MFDGGKKKSRRRLGRDTLNTCAECQGLPFKNGVDFWTFVRQSAKMTAWHRNYLFLCILYLGRYIVHRNGPTQSVGRILNICAKLCRNMPWSTWKRLVQIFVYLYGIFFSSYGVNA